MNYSRIYKELISSRRDSVPEGYIERHHIVPRCMGGSNDSSNIVSLTAREHYISHKLLYYMYPENNSLLFAWTMMTFCKTGNVKRNYNVTSRDYSKAKMEFSKRNKCKILSNETKRKIAAASIGNKKWLGKNHSEKTKKEMSIARLGKKWSRESNKKKARFGLTNSFYGKNHSEETRKILSNYKIGTKLSSDHKKNISSGLKGIMWMNDGISNIRIHNSEYEKYMNLGFSKGRIITWRRNNVRTK